MSWYSRSHHAAEVHAPTRNSDSLTHQYLPSRSSVSAPQLLPSAPTSEQPNHPARRVPDRFRDRDRSIMSNTASSIIEHGMMGHIYIIHSYIRLHYIAIALIIQPPTLSSVTLPLAVPRSAPPPSAARPSPPVMTWILYPLAFCLYCTGHALRVRPGSFTVW